MTNQEILFTIAKEGYHQTCRSSNDPTIVLAKERNVQLGYQVCHEIYKGPSHFVDPVAQEYYNNYTKAQLNLKMKQSQMTVESTQCDEDPTNMSFPHKTAHRKRNHSNVEKLNKSAFMQSTNLSDLVNSQVAQSMVCDSFDVQSIENDDNLFNRSKKKKLSASFVFEKSNENVKQKSFFYPSMNDQVRSEYGDFTEIEKLRTCLLEKEQELQACKKQLETYKQKQKLPEMRTISKHKIKEDLGGTIPALMYMTLLMVLFTKHTLSE